MMPPSFIAASVFKIYHRAAVVAVLVCFCQLAPAQVSDGKGLTPLEGVLPITDDRALWDAVKDSRDVSELQAYLAQFPKGLFATVAAIRIRALGGAGAATSPQAPPHAPTTTPRQNPAPGQIIKDCADCPEMVVIPAGSFEMGLNDNVDERPVHRVDVAGFLFGKTEVTQGQWKAVMGNNPSKFSQCGDDCPVEMVSWYEAQEFARRLSQKTGKQYRLPTEAEWEYAARAGTTTMWNTGDDENQLDNYAWYKDNSRARTHRAAEKKPNALGLYDMYGNVWEWVEDCWHDNYNAAPSDGSAWITDCSGNFRVFRGGSYGSFPTFLRSAYRSGIRYSPNFRDSSTGLRMSRTP